MLALAADKVVCRRAVVLNPHYKGMGNLFGSEYWTYSLPKRVGQQMAQQITTSLLPLGAEDALRIGMIDAVFPTKMSEFRHRVQEYAARLVTPSTFSQLLHDKNRRRSEDEVQKPLQQYRDEELANMRANFWGPDPAYHEARRRFVHKAPACRTPRHLAMHRI
jgi:putative two-component system hydrogenase maturation factor HypX/HoxX